MNIKDGISQEEVIILAKAGQGFVSDSLTEGKGDMATTLFLMCEKIRIFQIALISVMASVRKKEHVASFYSDILEMSSSGLETIMEHPEILEKTPLPPLCDKEESAVQDIIKLLKEING